MRDPERPWALILAAGDGRRLRRLTTTSAGISVPKQFCALDRGLSLLEEAVERARRVAEPSRVCAIVAARHEAWWSPQLEGLPRDNVIVQPENRGTANGVLLPLLRILRRDAEARVVLLPSDHHVREERTLARALRAALMRAGASWPQIVLLGIEPREPDAQLGYIVPGHGMEHGHRSVQRFVEKPAPSDADRLIAEGALWNAFIVAAEGQALLQLFERRCPEIVSAMRSIVTDGSSAEAATEALAQLYADLPELDFSTNILQGQEQYLRVMSVPECGWSDLGTPQRVAEAVHNLPQAERDRAEAFGSSRAFLSLAAQHRRQAHTGARAAGAG